MLEVNSLRCVYIVKQNVVGRGVGEGVPTNRFLSEDNSFFGKPHFGKPHLVVSIEVLVSKLVGKLRGYILSNQKSHLYIFVAHICIHVRIYAYMRTHVHI